MTTGHVDCPLYRINIKEAGPSGPCPVSCPGLDRILMARGSLADDGLDRMPAEAGSHLRDLMRLGAPGR